MQAAVGVLIIDEPVGLEPNFRAMLEHEPALRTISASDIGEEVVTDGDGRPVALVFACDANLDAAFARISAYREAHSSLRILVMFRALNAGTVRRLSEAGADGFIGRSASAREICDAIIAFAADAPADEDAMPPLDTRGADQSGLTPREAEVLRFLSSGFSNKEVARRLSLSVRTVETHRLNLRRKTQTGRLKDLVSLARQLGLDPVFDAEAQRNQSRH